MIPNARFWEFINSSWVKITLKPNQTMQHYVAHPTEEGWYSRHITWEHTGESVACQLTVMSRDCDGRLDRYNDFECQLPELQAREFWVQDQQDVARVPFWEIESELFESELLLPCWIESHCSQRDYTAEAMGY